MQKLKLQMFAYNNVSFAESIPEIDLSENPNVVQDEDLGGEVYHLYSQDTLLQSINYTDNIGGVYTLDSGNKFLTFSRDLSLWAYLFSDDAFMGTQLSAGWYSIDTDTFEITPDRPDFYIEDKVEGQHIICTKDYFLEMLPDAEPFMDDNKTPQQQFEENLTALANSIVDKTGTTDSTITGLKTAVDNIETGGGLDPLDSVGYYKATRPSDWLAMHLPSEMETLYPDTDRIEVLLEIPENGANMISFTITGNGTIDWGDGNSQSYNYTSDTEISHQYASTYANPQALVVISGTISNINFYVQYVYVNADGYSATMDWGAIGNNVLEIEGKISGKFFLNVDGSTSFYNLTYCGIKCNNIDEETSYMLSGCYSLLCCPELSFGDITSLEGMFCDSMSLESVPLFDTSNVTNMNGMFSGCQKIQKIPLFDTSNVTDMGSMFNCCYSLETLPLFDTSNVTNMSYMFYWCYSLKTVPLFDTSNVTDMGSMFNLCYVLENLPSFNTSNVTTTITIKDCAKLTKVPALDISKTTGSYLYLFNGCSSLTSIPEIDFGQSKLTAYKGFVESCYKLTEFKAKNLKYSFDISASTLFTRKALLEVLNNLATVTSKQTLTIGSENLSKLTSEDKAIATNKGWTLA